MSIELHDDDVHLQLRLSGRVRRALIRHFVVFLKAKIAERSYAAADPLLFNQDMIEDKAWELAETVIADTEGHAERLINGAAGLDEVVAAVGGDPSPLALVRAVLDETIADAERGFLDDPLTGLNALIELASGHFPEIR
jgi:hypothetical protein